MAHPGAVRWADLERESRHFASELRSRLEAPGVLLVVTVRRDGTPRLSPVEPFFWDGDLWLPMMWRSAKVRDLDRDPRVLIHSVVTRPAGDEGEVKLRGETVRERSRAAEVCTAIADTAEYEPDPARVELFRLLVRSVALVSYLDGNQFAALWPERRQFMRRETSPTSVGEEEPADFVAWD